MKEQSRVRLSKQEQQELRRLLQSGLQPVRTVLRALALRQLAEGQTVRQVAKNVALTPKTVRSEEHTSELQSHLNIVCRLLLEKKNDKRVSTPSNVPPSHI